MFTPLEREKEGRDRERKRGEREIGKFVCNEKYPGGKEKRRKDH